MEVLGSYYSHTLLNAILSHSVRWCKNSKHIHELLSPYENGALFSRQARSMVFSEISTGHPKVPTVQTLLLLSAQECSAGNRTQAWLYSGMAFRLIEDMGITYTADGGLTGLNLEDEDVEIRQRLFWSCYFWDKMVSLYLGRTPMLQHSGMSPNQIMRRYPFPWPWFAIMNDACTVVDDLAEHELWSPHGVEYARGSEYPPTMAHSITCFRWMCRLSIIFNQILIHIYDPAKQHSDGEMRACLQSEGESLKQWWDDLPAFLKIDTDNLPQHCPPSHIVTLKYAPCHWSNLSSCLYHVFKILLYRPMLFQKTSMIHNRPRADPQHLVECISSATSIITVYDLFCRSFGYEYTVLSLSYSIYTAASIFLLQIQAAPSHNTPALIRLRYCISALERLSVSNPVVHNALDLVNAALSHVKPDMPDERSVNHDTAEAGIPTLSSLPRCDPTEDGADYPGTDMYTDPAFHTFDPEGFVISDETLEAFPFLTPIDATFGTNHGLDL